MSLARIRLSAYEPLRNLNVVMKRFIKFFVTLDTHLIFEKDLTIKSTSDFTPKMGVEFSVASTEDLRNLLGVSGGPISDEELATAKERLNRGDICFIGVHDGMIVNYAWTSFTNAELLDSIFSPHSGVAYHYKAYTIPRFRGQGLHLASLAFSFDYLANAGQTKMWLYVHVKNHASLKNYRRYGCREVGTIRHVRFLRKYKVLNYVRRA